MPAGLGRGLYIIFDVIVKCVEVVLLLILVKISWRNGMLEQRDGVVGVSCPMLNAHFWQQPCSGND